MADWSELLGDLPLLADGPVEGWLRQRGLLVPPPTDLDPQAGPADMPPERLNLERPDLVTAAHRSYLRAGARLHRTNTLRGNALDLAAHGLADRAEALNNSGAAALRQAIGLGAILAGRIGPAARAASPAERQQAYGEQAIYLSDTGADLLLLEGFPSADEAVLALRAAGDAHAAPALVLLAAASPAPPREAIERAARSLRDAGAEGLGVIGPSDVLAPWVEGLRAAGLPLAAFLDAEPGAPPDTFAEALAGWAARGVAIVGGGAGALPAHIRAAALRLGKQVEG